MRFRKIYGFGCEGHRKTTALRTLATSLIICFGALCVSRTADARSRFPGRLAQLERTHGEIRLEGDGFNVMNVQLVLGSRLRFANPADKPLDIGIVTWRGRLVKELSIPAHARAAWTPVRCGVYDYFDVETTDFGGVALKGAGGEKVYQPVARENSKSFPMPAYGVVAVTNSAGGGIAPSSRYGPLEASGASNSPGAHDSAFEKRGAWIEVSGATMTFEPWVLVVKAGQPIHLYNEDSMGHSFYPGDYPVMYKDHNQIHFYRYPFEGFKLRMNGGHRSITFHRPGIHHIVCYIHTIAWKHTYRSYPRYGGYPYVMDAVVVVEPGGPRL